METASQTDKLISVPTFISRILRPIRLMRFIVVPPYYPSQDLVKRGQFNTVTMPTESIPINQGGEADTAATQLRRIYYEPSESPESYMPSEPSSFSAERVDTSIDNAI